MDINANAKNEIISLSTDLTEAGIDNLLEEGFLKDLPIIGSVVGIIKTSKYIQEQLLVKKILYFLKEIKGISTNEKTDFINKLNNDKKYQTKVEESLLLIINRLNDYSKSEYIGKLFVATILGKIDYNTFLKLSNMIDRCYIGDLDNLILFYNGNKNDVDTDDVDTLYNLGVLINTGISGKTFFYDENKPIPNKKPQYEINKYGKLIVEIILKKK